MPFRFHNSLKRQVVEQLWTSSGVLPFQLLATWPDLTLYGLSELREAISILMESGQSLNTPWTKLCSIFHVDRCLPLFLDMDVNLELDNVEDIGSTISSLTALSLLGADNFAAYSLLLDAGADVFDFRAVSTICLRRLNERQSIIQLFLDRYFDIDMVRHGDTLLQVAVRMHDVSMVDFLLRNGVRISKPVYANIADFVEQSLKSPVVYERIVAAGLKPKQLKERELRLKNEEDFTLIESFPSIHNEAMTVAANKIYLAPLLEHGINFDDCLRCLHGTGERESRFLLVQEFYRCDLLQSGVFSSAFCFCPTCLSEDDPPLPVDEFATPIKAKVIQPSVLSYFTKVACEEGIDYCAEELMITALEFKSVTLFTFLIDHCFDMYDNDNNVTYLMKLMESRSPELILTFLDRGFDINRADVYGRTALHYACHLSLSKVALLLLDHGASLTIESFPDKRSPLHFALQSTSTKMLKFLLDNGTDVNSVNSTQCTMLHLESRPQVMKFLLDRGANVNAKDIDGNTPLMKHMTIVSVTSIDIAKLLLEVGADINVRNCDNRTALDIALRNKQHASVIDLLLTAKVKEMEFTSVARTGDVVDRSTSPAIGQN